MCSNRLASNQFFHRLYKHISTLDSVSRTRDSGYYSCSAVSSSGSSIARAQIKIESDLERPPPVIQLGPANQSLAEGSDARMPCKVFNPQVVDIGWLKDGLPLDEGGTSRDRIRLENDNTLVIKGKF